MLVIANADAIRTAETARRAAVAYLSHHRDTLHRELYTAWRAHRDPQRIADELPALVTVATVRRAVLRYATPDDYRAHGALWLPAAPRPK